MQEKPDYEFCGNCNNCISRESPTELRDYTKETDAILQAVKQLGEKWSSKTRLINKAREIFRKNYPSPIKQPTTPLLDHLLIPLVEHQYLARSTQRGSFGGGGGGQQARTNTWEVYVLGQKRRTNGSGTTGEVMLAPPQSVLDFEEGQRQAMNEKLERYKKLGVNLTLVPQEELDAGTGPILMSMVKWHKMIKRYRESERPGDDEKATGYEELFQRVRHWRSHHAEKLGIAPANIMAEHLIYKICFTKPTRASDLQEIGIFVTGIQSLVDVVSSSVQELGLTNTNKETDMVVGNKMILPKGTCIRTPIPPFNPTKPKKPSTKPLSCEVSWELFQRKNKSPVAIALERNFGLRTVVSHLLYAMNMPKPLDLERLYQQLPADEIVLNENVWNELEKINIWNGDLSSTSLWKNGTGMTNFKLANSQDLLRLVKGGFLTAIIDTEYKSRDDDDQKILSYWARAVERWSLLKRACVPITFEEGGGGGSGGNLKRSISDDNDGDDCDDDSSKSKSSTNQPYNKKQRMFRM